MRDTIVSWAKHKFNSDIAYYHADKKESNILKRSSLIRVFIIMISLLV